MTDYRYRVTLRADGCGSQRFVAYADDRFLDYAAAGEEAVNQMTTQNCPRCRGTHTDDEYFPVDVQRGETGFNGEMYWRDAYPTRVDEWAHPELFA